MCTTFLGGGFGRRAEVDLVRQAVTCAHGDAGAAGPGPVVARAGHPPRLLSADGAGALAGRARHVGRRAEAGERRQAPGGAVAGRSVPGARGRPAVARASRRATPSRIRPTPFRSTSSRPSCPDGSVPVGFWRSVGHSHTAFFDESFVDELALALKKDPFEFRRELAGRSKPRHLKVLETVAKEAGWGAAAAGGVGPRHALRASFGSIVAQVAEVAVTDGKTLRGQARHLRHRLRAGGQSRHRARADGERHHLRPLGRALRRDHAGQRRRRAVELPDYDAVRLADAPAMAVHLVDTGSSVHRRRRRARHAADRARRRQRRSSPPPASALRNLPLRLLIGLDRVLHRPRGRAESVPEARGAAMIQRGIFRRQRSVSSICAARSRWGDQPSSRSAALAMSPTSLGESPGRRGPTACGTGAAGDAAGLGQRLAHAVARAAAEVERLVAARRPAGRASRWREDGRRRDRSHARSRGCTSRRASDNRCRAG